MADDLYDQDYYAWALKQAEALRRRDSGSNVLDYDNLAEEVWDLGAAQLQACESHVINILAHFLKLQHSLADLPNRGWKKEIAAFRIGLRRKLTPTIERKLRDGLDDLYADARRLAVAAFADDEPETKVTLPTQSPYSWDDVLGRGSDWLPERA